MGFALAGNEVTRHDAVASVRAGFTGRELSRLWPDGHWRLREALALPFTHVFSARRGAVWRRRDRQGPRGRHRGPTAGAGGMVGRVDRACRISPPQGLR